MPNFYTRKEIIREYKHLCRIWKKIPTIVDLRNNGYSKLEHGIVREFGKLTNLRKIAGILANINPPGYWTEGRTVSELQKFCRINRRAVQQESIGRLLIRKGKKKLCSAIHELGGFRKLNAAFNIGLKVSKRAMNEEQILNELRIIEQSGHQITGPLLKKINQTHLLYSIEKIATINYFKEKLGYRVKKRVRWTKEKTITEYLDCHKMLGMAPTVDQLFGLERINLVYGIRKYFGGLTNLRKRLNIPLDRRPVNYWTIKNTIKELKQFILDYPEVGKEINAKIFEKYGKEKLKRAIYMHGGLRKLNIRYRLGLDISRKSWSKKEVVLELKRLDEQGIEITQKSLIALDRNDLLGAMRKYGGMNVFKEKMGLKIKRYKYWTDEKVIDQLKPIIKEYGRFPSEMVFKYLGKSEILSQCEKRGGVKKYCQLLKTTSNGYYLSNDGHYLQSGYECIFDNILHKYNISHQVHGKLGQSQFRYDFLINNTYVEICGYDREEHPAYFKRLDRKIDLYERSGLKFKIIYKKTFNAGIGIVEQNVIRILSTITKSCGPTKVVENCDILPSRYWTDIENVKKELLPLIKKYGRMPFDRELRAAGKSALIHGIFRYHGSFFKLGKRLNIKVMYKPKGFYCRENAIKEYEQLCLKANRYVSLSDLQTMKYYGLAAYITKNGGFFEFRKLISLNFPLLRLPNGYYSEERVLTEYKELCMKWGRYVSSKELTAMRAGSLAQNIQKNGGYHTIRKKLGLNYPPLRNLTAEKG